MQNKSRAWQYREWYLHIWSFLSTFIITPFLSWSTRYAPNEHLFSLLITAQLQFREMPRYSVSQCEGKVGKFYFCFCFAVLKLKRVKFSQRKHCFCCLFFSKRQKLLDRSRASTCQVWRIMLVEHHVITKSVESIGQISSHIYNCNCLYIAPITVVNRVLWWIHPRVWV